MVVEKLIYNFFNFYSGKLTTKFLFHHIFPTIKMTIKSYLLTAFELTGHLSPYAVVSLSNICNCSDCDLDLLVTKIK